MDVKLITHSGLQALTDNARVDEAVNGRNCMRQASRRRILCTDSWQKNNVASEWHEIYDWRCV